ncbi:PASTA domain-containing protein [Streptomyces sp. NPDC052015]|uniref:Stk1 family PASTA domain-containing Ser/Thr kinase n=1 Tax=Streptomyces sp. NPDC052015 TaxID=3154755 RepID=UPI00343EB9D7
MSQHHQPGFGTSQQPGWGPPPPAPKRTSAGKIVGLGCLGIVAFFVVVTIIGAIVGSGDDTKADSSSTASAEPGVKGDDKGTSVATSSAPAAAQETDTDTGTDTAKKDDAETATLPDMKGKGLQSAQDQAQAAGFFYLTSHDALGRGRMQVLDRNWKVCSQTPAAGAHPTDTKVDFGTVKLEEECPAKDAGTVAEAGATMPDFVGKSVKVARQALDDSTSITVKDASGDDRMVLLESNWKVCGQTPAAGSEIDGRPVTFTAVKFGESC